MSDTEREYSMRGIIRVCRNRGWDEEQITQFIHSHGDIINGYTERMVDAFEFAVNESVIGKLHPDMGREL